MAVRLSDLRLGRSLLPRNIIFLPMVLLSVRLSKPQGLLLMKGLGKLKKCIRIVGTQTRALPASSIVTQPFR
jgi:hypothetical protein